MKKNKNLLVQPFLKWAGGKRQLIPQMEKYLSKIKYSTYYEPFLGGGSILLYLQPKKAVVNDYNKDLIECYKCIKNNYDELVSKLEEYEKKNNEEDFYKIREIDRTDEYKKLSSVEKAARLIYLNRTCYNGLFRLNSSGQFNTPFGKYKNPNICNKPVLRALHEYFNNNEIEFITGDFETACDSAPTNSLVYFDPPYDQFEEQVNFVGYTENGFTRDDQIRLKKLCDKLIEKGCTVVVSNSATPFIKELYGDKTKYSMHIVMAKRNINSNGKKRGEIQEVLIIGKGKE